MKKNEIIFLLKQTILFYLLLRVLRITSTSVPKPASCQTSREFSVKTEFVVGSGRIDRIIRKRIRKKVSLDRTKEVRQTRTGRKIWNGQKPVWKNRPHRGFKGRSNNGLPFNRSTSQRSEIRQICSDGARWSGTFFGRKKSRIWLHLQACWICFRTFWRLQKSVSSDGWSGGPRDDDSRTGNAPTFQFSQIDFCERRRHVCQAAKVSWRCQWKFNGQKHRRIFSQIRCDVIGIQGRIRK